MYTTPEYTVRKTGVLSNKLPRTGKGVAQRHMTIQQQASYLAIARCVPPAENREKRKAHANTWHWKYHSGSSVACTQKKNTTVQ